MNDDQLLRYSRQIMLPQVDIEGQERLLAATVLIVGLGGLGSPGRAGGLRLALAAVLEDQQGALSYWALAHPPGKPDFHHPVGFTLELHAP